MSINKGSKNILKKFFVCNFEVQDKLNKKEDNNFFPSKTLISATGYKRNIGVKILNKIILLNSIDLKIY